MAVFVLYINGLPDNAIYADLCWDQTSDLWQQLELASELESNLKDTGLAQEMAW